jgi:AcrR family transcriptional regulator
MSPRPDVSDERTSQILTAAEGVFTKKGFDDARMEDIAEKTGLSKGTLYLYFKSKDELIFAILDRIFQSEFRQLAGVKEAHAGAAEALLAVTDMVSRDVAGMLRLIPLIYNFLALAFRSKPVQRALKEYIRGYLDILTPIIQTGIDSGEFRAVEARQVALAAGAIIEGTLLLWVYDNASVDPEHDIRAGMRILLDGVKAGP